MLGGVLRGAKAAGTMLRGAKTAGTMLRSADSINQLKNNNREAIEKLSYLENQEKKNVDAEKKILKTEEKKLREHLPSRAALWKAFWFALIVGDVVGFFLPTVTGFGLIIDVIMLFGLASMLKQNPVGFRRMAVAVIEAIPAVEQFPFYTLMVIIFYLQHKSEYGTLKDIVSARKQLGNEGIFNTVSLTGASFFLPLVSILFFGSIFWGLGTPHDSPLNPVGEAVVNNVPILAALESSGRISGIVDKTTVGTSNFNNNVDPLGWFNDLMNKSVVIAGDNYYTTEIEDTRNLDLGLSVRDIQYLNYYQVGDEVSFSYFVSGGTFTDLDDGARTYCYLNKAKFLRDGSEINGTTNPQTIPLIKDLPVYELIMCEGIDTEGFDSGFYQAVAGISYDFEVWSYIPYTFVSRSTFEAYGQEINKRLNIDTKTQSLSTNGPVVLSISELASSIPQPYVVHEDRKTNFAVDFKLENLDNGRLEKLDYVILQVPEEFEVICARPNVEYNTADLRSFLVDELNENGQEDVSFLQDYKIIRISNFDKRELENTVLNFRCALTLPENSGFLGSSTKTTKTIVATAKYTYEKNVYSTLELSEQVGVVS